MSNFISDLSIDAMDVSGEQQVLKTTLIPMSDQHLISPQNIILESNVEVTRVTEMITDHTNSYLFYKFSLSEPQEMYREQYGEYAY